MNKSLSSAVAYKLFSQRRDGSLGPLFIGKRKRLRLGEWYPAEDIPTKGYAHRPGWHCVPTPCAPHLSEKNKVWAKVLINEVQVYDRPKHQGGQWYLAKSMQIIEVLQ